MLGFLLGQSKVQVGEFLAGLIRDSSGNDHIAGRRNAAMEEEACKVVNLAGLFDVQLGWRPKPGAAGAEMQK